MKIGRISPRAAGCLLSKSRRGDGSVHVPHAPWFFICPANRPALGRHQQIHCPANPNVELPRLEQVHFVPVYLNSQTVAVLTNAFNPSRQRRLERWA